MRKSRVGRERRMEANHEYLIPRKSKMYNRKKDRIPPAIQETDILCHRSITGKECGSHKSGLVGRSKTVEDVNGLVGCGLFRVKEGVSIGDSEFREFGAWFPFIPFNC